MDFNRDAVIQRINDKLKEKNITKKAVAEDIGMSEQSIGNNLSLDKTVIPDVKTLFHICKLLDVSSDYILFGDEKISIKDYSNITSIDVFRAIQVLMFAFLPECFVLNDNNLMGLEFIEFTAFNSVLVEFFKDIKKLVPVKEVMTENGLSEQFNRILVEQLEKYSCNNSLDDIIKDNSPPQFDETLF